ncbi:4-hydroxy-2-oxo-heptane-1,7-dioate aldolase [subsurface metagenome]
MALNVTYNLKLKMQAGEKVFGQIIGPGNEPEKTVKALKDFGYDFIMMENEHSLVDKETVFEYIRASRKLGIPILMRPEENFANFRCYLDAGVNGFMLPQVNTVEEVVSAINRAYFPPIGQRGSGLGLSPYLLDFQDHNKIPFLTLLEYINNNMVVFPQTETLQCIKNLPRILRLEGVTGTIVGSNDLALDIGGIDPKALMSEMTATPIIEEKFREILKICKDAGKVAGISGFPVKRLAEWAREGYQLIILGYVIDGNVDTLRPHIEEIKSLIG